MGLRSTAPATRPDAGSPSRRLAALDAARGTAMVLVCLSHFAITYLILPVGAEPPAGKLLTGIGYIASPTFMLISGFVIGYLTTVRADRAAHYHRHLTDRALVLLTIGHVWLGLTDAIHAGGVGPGLARGFITDVIGVSLLVMVPLSRRVSTGVRLVAGITVALASYAWALSAHPTGAVARVVHETLFGPAAVPVRGYTFPLLPWFGVYLAASAVGAASAPLLQSSRLRTLGIRFLSCGALAAALVAGSRLLARHLTQAGTVVPAWVQAATTPWAKQPPGPGYLLFFGGVGAALIGALFLLPATFERTAPMRTLRLLGRNSLFVYLYQNLVYFVVLVPIGHATLGRLWVAPLVGSLVLVVAGTAVWERLGGNRWLTLGIRGGDTPTARPTRQGLT